MKILAPILALFLSACASTKSTFDIEALRREEAANYSDLVVEIHSLPSGAMIDLNGDVVGITPCTLELKRCYKKSWPANGYLFQNLRVRFWDGSIQTQTFPTATDTPQKVAFIHPHAQNFPRALTLK